MVLGGLTSCIKDEPLNAEADIERVAISAPHPELIFYNLADTAATVLATDSVVTFNVRRDAPLEGVEPRFTLTPGATIQGLDGGDFASQQGRARYRVTSEDGNWHRDYTVVLEHHVTSQSDTLHYDFEHYELNNAGQYYLWHDVLADGTLGNNWATGNPGYRLSRSSAAPDEYPTVPIVDGGVSGSAVRLVTRDTGPFGVMVNKRIAAGNLFLGNFDVTNALRDALQATQFGIPFDKQPVKFNGYYKYSPGPKFQDPSGNEVAGVTDSASVYAVFYVNHDARGNAVMLHGDDVQTNQHIVAIAKVQPLPATTEWTWFEAEFVYLKEVDQELLQEMGYNLTIVFSSSIEGDKFSGAVGSELCIDQVQLICTTQE